MKLENLLHALERSCEMPAISCPRCQKHLNRAAASDADDAVPKPGDLTICCYCNAVLKFQVAGLRLMTDTEVAALDDDFLLVLLEALVGAYIMRKVMR